MPVLNLGTRNTFESFLSASVTVNVPDYLRSQTVDEWMLFWGTPVNMDRYNPQFEGQTATVSRGIS